MIELYILPGCPYCAQVQDKLDELGIEYETSTVPPAKHQRSAVKEISGQTGVPVLVDPENNVHGMPESTEIIDYLERRYA